MKRSGDIKDCLRLLDNSTTGIIAVDYDGLPIYVNKTLIDKTGFSKEDFMRDGFFVAIHPDYRKLVAYNFAARIHGEPAPSEYDIKVVRKSGEEFWISAHLSLDEIFGKKAVVVHAVDINRRKKAEFELVRREKKWRKLFENSLDGRRKAKYLPEEASSSNSETEPDIKLPDDELGKF